MYVHNVKYLQNIQQKLVIVKLIIIHIKKIQNIKGMKRTISYQFQLFY